MPIQDDFPTELTIEEKIAGFQLRWITNDWCNGRTDEPERLKAVVRVISDTSLRLVKTYNIEFGRTFYRLEMFGVFATIESATKESWHRPPPDDKPAWRPIYYPDTYQLADPFETVLQAVRWVSKHPDQKYEPREAPELPLVK